MSDMLRRVVMMMGKVVIPPTYATWNPADKYAFLTLSGGNLVATLGSSDAGQVRSTIGKSSGKWYWEVTFTSGSNSQSIGITKSGTTLTTYVGAEADEWGYFSANGQIFTAGSGSAYGATFTSGDIIGHALDMDAGELTLYKNNASQGVAVTGLSGSIFAAWSGNSTAGSKVGTANFGATALTYSPPAGFNAGLYT